MRKADQEKTCDEESGITVLLSRMSKGDEVAQECLYNAIYDDLSVIARAQLSRERDDHTWSTTDLAHETICRTLGSPSVLNAENSVMFFGLLVTAMRRALIDHARGRNTERRGGGKRPMPLDAVMHDLSSRGLAIGPLDEALDRLEREEPEAYTAFTLWFFAGRSDTEIARWFGVTDRTVRNRIHKAKHRLRELLGEGGSHAGS